MSEYGVHILNIQAGSIYEFNNGIRDRLDTTPAMLINSLFKDFLVENGLKLYGKKNDRTRDIICLEFDYGSRSAKEEEKHVKKLINNIEKNYPADKQEQMLEFYQEKLQFIEDNKEKFDKKNRQQLRVKYYEEGVDVTYNRYDKKDPKHIISSQTIHYKMLYRTPGKAKKGTCMFICKRLYNKARNFLYMGIKLPKKNAPIVEIGAYSSLITSAIEDRIQIDPKQILVIPDVESEYYADVITVNIDENRHCYAKNESDYRLVNTLFDGQALIDSSIFPEWANGYILLRHHMCKMAAFHSNIQLFFKDWCEKNGKDYETYKVKDYWGNEVYVKDVKLITTENAMKWLKFNISYEYWSEWVGKNDNMFGIVKTAHPSKLGNVQQMSYQMVNSLDIDTIGNVVSETESFIDKLKNDDEVFLQYLKDNDNFSNDFIVLHDLVQHNPDFINSDYFKSRRKFIIDGYIYNINFGKLIQKGDNLVIVGSPYAMLLHSVGDDWQKDHTFSPEDDCIQCYTERFRDGEYLAEFRSPFNSRNNMGCLHNVYSEEMQRYFNFGEQIIAVNLIGTPFQDRNNGLTQWVSVQKCA